MDLHAVDLARDEIGDDPMAAIAAGRQLEHAVDPKRLRHVQDDPRDTRARLPEANVLDQTGRLRPRIVGDRPGDLRQIDREARWLGERDVAEFHRPAEVDHDPRGDAVARDPNIVDARLGGHGVRPRQGYRRSENDDG